jgi:hypothetical protein
MRIILILFLFDLYFLSAEKYNINMYDDEQEKGFWKMVGISGVWDQENTNAPQKLTDYKINDNDLAGSYGIYENGNIPYSEVSLPKPLVKLTIIGDIKEATISNINTSEKFVRDSLTINDIVAGREVSQIWATMYIASPFSNGTADIKIQYDASLEETDFDFFVSTESNNSEVYSTSFSSQYNNISNPSVGVLKLNSSILDTNFTSEVLISQAFDTDIHNPLFNQLTSNDELMVYKFNSVDNFWPIYNSKNLQSSSNDFNTFKAGNGYWIKFDAYEPHKQGGIIAYSDGINIKNSDYYSSIIQEGWNLLTLPESPVISTPNGFIIEFSQIADKYSTLLISDKVHLEEVAIPISGNLNLTTTVMNINEQLKNNSYLKKIMAFPVKYYDDSQNKTGILLLSPFEFKVSDEKMQIINDSELSYFLPYNEWSSTVAKSWKIEIASPLNTNEIFNFNFKFDSNNDGTKNLQLTSSITVNGNTDKYNFFSELKSNLESIGFDSTNNKFVDTRTAVGSFETMFDISYNLYNNEIIISLKNINYNDRVELPVSEITAVSSNYSDSLIGEIKDLIFSENFTLSENLASKYSNEEINNTKHIFGLTIKPNIDFINHSKIEKTVIKINDDEVSFYYNNNDQNITQTDLLNHINEQINETEKLAILIDTNFDTTDNDIFDDDEDLFLITSQENFTFKNLYNFKTFSYDTDSQYDALFSISTTSEQVRIPMNSSITEAITIFNSNTNDINFTNSVANSGNLLAFSKELLFTIEQIKNDDYTYNVIPKTVLFQGQNNIEDNFLKGYLHLPDFINNSKFYFDDSDNMSQFFYKNLDILGNLEIKTTNTIQDNILQFLNNISDDLKSTEIISSIIVPQSLDDDSVLWERVPLEKLPSEWIETTAESSLYSKLFYVRKDKAYWVRFRNTEETNFQTQLQIDTDNTYLTKYITHQTNKNGENLNLFKIKAVVGLKNVKDINSIRGFIKIGNNRIPLSTNIDLDYLEVTINSENLTEVIEEIQEIEITVFDSFGEKDTYSLNIDLHKPDDVTGNLLYFQNSTYETSLTFEFDNTELQKVQSYYKNIDSDNLLHEFETSGISSYTLEICQINEDMEFKPYLLLFYGMTDLSKNLASYSDTNTLVYAPIFYNTSKLTSEYMVEDIKPDSFDEDCNIESTELTNNGVAFLNQLESNKLSIFYEAETYSNENMSNVNYNTSDSMFVAYDGELLGRIKFSPLYRTKQFFILNETTNETFSGTFEEDIYTNDGNPFSLTKLN